MSLPTLSENASSTDIADALAEAATGLVELRNKRSRGEATDTDVTDAKERVAFINDLDAIMRATQAVEQSRRSASGSRGPTAAMDELGEQVLRSLGDRFTAHEDYQRAVGNHNFGSESFDLKVDQARTLLTSSTGDTSSAGTWIPIAQPVAPQPRQRRLFVRDLMPAVATTAPSVPYIIESSPLTTETGASFTAEGGQKAEVEIDFALRQAYISKITAWVPATEEILEDAPVLRSYIDNRLTYMIALREEQQILFGAGTGAQLKGVLTWNSGAYQNQTQAAVTGDFSATVAKAVGLVENVDADADAGVFNAIDYWNAVATRHTTQFDNGFGGNAPAVVAGITWGLATIRTRAMTTGNFAVGAFAMGGTILDRQDIVIRVGNQHLDYFTTNKVAILAEKRVGVINHRPDVFVNGQLA